MRAIISIIPLLALTVGAFCAIDGNVIAQVVGGTMVAGFGMGMCCCGNPKNDCGGCKGSKNPLEIEVEFDLEPM
jgi:hypothetical protein